MEKQSRGRIFLRGEVRVVFYLNRSLALAVRTPAAGFPFAGSGLRLTASRADALR
ncbi:MAG: hypothetical protein JO166_07580 [Deltaproteobacteria bacterium]|nr:hypothetical protein [Deltaproteobacteria bacterium]